MKSIIAHVVILMLAKALYSEEYDYWFPGEDHSVNDESRYVVCNQTDKSYYNPPEKCNLTKVLKVQNCPAETIESTFIRYRNVHTLDISFSNYMTLSDLHLNYEYLVRFNVSYNNVTEIHRNLFNNTEQLMAVDFSHNQIDKIHKLAFSKVPKLLSINISHNLLEQIDLELFKGLTDLEELDLSDNDILIRDFEEIFTKNFKLKTLNLKNNRIFTLGCDIIDLLGYIKLMKITFEQLFLVHIACGPLIRLKWEKNGNEIIFKNARNQNELPCIMVEFKNVKQIFIHDNEMQNPIGLVNMLGESIEKLDLSGNTLGRLNETTFQNLKKLHKLNLSKTNLSFAGLNPFHHLNQLYDLDISYNHLTTLNISLFAKTLRNLQQFKAAGNHFHNCLEIIRSLGPNLVKLDLSQNSIGRLKTNTFEHLEYLENLELSDTNLDNFDVQLFNIGSLDISRNNLKRLNVTMLSHTLKRLKFFYASDNDFENTAEIMQHLNFNLQVLDLSGSIVGRLNETIFKSITIQSLKLRSTNLAISDMKPFESSWLEYLDISNNSLTKMNFSTSFTFQNLATINLGENHLTRLVGLTKDTYPALTELNITENKINCAALPLFKNDWRELKIFGDNCSQFEANSLQSSTPKATVQAGIPVVSYVVPSGVAAVIIIIVAIVFFLRRKRLTRNGGQMEGSCRENDNGEELQLESLPQPEAEEESNPEDHIYEEIEERECPYDHLTFEFDPMPIDTTNQHYFNYTLVNRDRGTEQ